MNLERTTDPVNDAVLTTLVEQQLYISSGESPLVIANAIKSAVMSVEQDCDRSLITQSWTMTLDYFPDVITLPKGKIQSITSFTYIDADDAEQTLAQDTDYRITTVGSAQRLIPIGDYPNLADDTLDVVKIEWVSGYGDDDTDVPENLKQAILLKVKEHYDGTDVTDAYNMATMKSRLIFDYAILNSVYDSL